MFPACSRGSMTAGPDVVRGSGPNHSHGLDTLDPKAGFPDQQNDRFASRHNHPRNSKFVCRQRFIVLLPSLSGRCREYRRLIGPASAHDGPGDACCFVCDSDRDDLGRLLRQQFDDPGILVRLSSSLPDHCRRSDDEQTPEISVALLGYAAQLFVLRSYSPDSRGHGGDR